MNRHVSILMIVLAAQLLAVGAVALLNPARGGGPDSSLLDLDPDVIDGVSIADGEGASVTLRNAQGAWRIDDGLPAESGKVAELVETFANLDAAWPVATSTSTAERFEVTDDAFQRHLEFRNGDAVVGEVFLGTSPGYRRVHGRVAGSDDIYSIQYSNYQAGTSADDWLDKTLLQPEGELTVVGAGDWTLTRAAGAWALDGDDPTDQAAARDMAGKVEDLRVIGVANADPEAEPTRTLALTDANGDYQLAIVVDEDNTDALVRSSRFTDRWFRVATYTVEQLAMARDDFVAVESPETDAPATPAETFIDDVLEDS